MERKSGQRGFEGTNDLDLTLFPETAGGWLAYLRSGCGVDEIRDVLLYHSPFHSVLFPVDSIVHFVRLATLRGSVF